MNISKVLCALLVILNITLSVASQFTGDKATAQIELLWAIGAILGGIWIRLEEIK